MNKVNPPFRADHVGSLLRPRGLLDARQRFQQGEISRAELRAVEDDAIRDVIRKEEAVGLQSITDGEFRRTYFHVDFLERLQGVSSVAASMCSSEVRQAWSISRRHA